MLLIDSIYLETLQLLRSKLAKLNKKGLSKVLGGGKSFSKINKRRGAFIKHQRVMLQISSQALISFKVDPYSNYSRGALI